jgi:hypothetical protein
MARQHPRYGADGMGSGSAVEIGGDTAGVGRRREMMKLTVGAHLTERREEAASSEGANQKGKRTSENMPPTHGLVGPARMASDRERRRANGAGWAKGRVGR